MKHVIDEKKNPLGRCSCSLGQQAKVVSHLLSGVKGHGGATEQIDAYHVGSTSDCVHD